MILTKIYLWYNVLDGNQSMKQTTPYHLLHENYKVNQHVSLVSLLDVSRVSIIIQGY